MIDTKQFCNQWLLSRRLNLLLPGTAPGRTSLLALLAIVLMLCPLMGRTQELTATLSGVVTDTTGAVVPHASVTIALNGVNGIARIVESDGDGSYTATSLTAGTYSITVTAPGFETYKGKGIVLNVAEKHAFNAQLKTGSVSTTVTVEDNPVSVDTETSSQAGTISGLQVRELEINSRNFEQLITLQPGVVNQLGDEAGASSTAMSVNGARTSANNWTVDGADINDSGSNTTALNSPSIEAIQEITLERGNYDAGYGRSGGGQVLVATRSGTSAFHGEGYEYVRNTVFNANDWLNKHSQLGNLDPVTKLPAPLPNQAGVYHQNVYGFVIGGPLYIPKTYNTAKNKTFFFWSEDWHKITQAGSSITLQTPTSAEMAGQFTVPAPATSGSLIAPPALPANMPSTCETFTRNPDGSGQGTIDVGNPACVSKNAQIYLTNVFAKNTNDSGSEIVNVPTKNDYRDDIVRIDHYFNDKVHLFARGLNDVMPVSNPLGLWAGNNFPNVAAASVDSPGKNVVGNLTWTISPKIVNELEFVYSQGTYNSTFTGSNFANNASLLSSLQPNTTQFADPYNRMPSVNITNIQGISPGSTPWKERNLDRTYYDNLSLNYGKHTFRLGFQIQQMLKTENAVAGGATFNFNQPYDQFANFMLGNVNSYTQQNRDTVPDLNYYNSEAYVNDDWKLSHKLTVNIGLRWSSFPSPTDKKNLLANFDPSLYRPNLAPIIGADGNYLPGQIINGSELLPANYANGMIFPKGAACAQAQSYGSMVQCSPYGKTIDPASNTNFAPRVGFAYNPDGRGITSIRAGFGIFYDRILNGIFEQSAFYDPPVVQSVTINTTNFDQPLGGTAAKNYGPNMLWTTGLPVFKTPSYGDYNVTIERQLLPTTVLSVAYVGGQGRHLLGELDLNQPTLGARLTNEAVDVNALRPYQGYSYFDTKASVFTSNYSSLQVSMNHRSSDGLTVGLAYTWSKTMTTNSVDRAGNLNGNTTYGTTNTYDLKMDYGPAAFNMPQNLTFNYVYESPFYRGRHGAPGLLLGGWELSGITSMLTGVSTTVVQNEDPFNTTTVPTTDAANPFAPNRGLGIQTVDGHIAARPNLIAPLHMTKNPQTHWFDPTSFQQSSGKFSALAPGSVLGPGVQKWDMALAKNTDIGEHVKFQLRAEAFDVFNHPNFTSVSSNIDATNFGKVTGDHEPRLLQLGGKITF